MKAIVERVDTVVSSAYNTQIAKGRKQQVGSGMRGDKVRTYRFQDDRVQDHNTGKTATVKKVMAGEFNLLW